jgi:hypothetical protein
MYLFAVLRGISSVKMVNKPDDPAQVQTNFAKIKR